MKYSLVLFDLDGTINNSSKGIISSLQYMLSKFNIKKDDSELYKYIGPALRDNVRDLLGDEQVEAGVKLYREYFTTVGMFTDRPYDGIPDLFHDLKKNGIKIGVATSKPQVYAVEILKNVELFEKIDIICGTPLSGDTSDKRELIESCIEELGVQKSDVVMIGDRKFDLMAAADAGVDAVGVLYGFGSKEELSAYDSVYLAESPRSLGEFLLGK